LGKLGGRPISFGKTLKGTKHKFERLHELIIILRKLQASMGAKSDLLFFIGRDEIRVQEYLRSCTLSGKKKGSA
jgi:hypothetical protein